MTAGDLPDWGDPDQPLVYVTFGTVAAGFEQFAAVFRVALDALADLPVRVLLTTGPAGDPESLRPWPANAHVERWWPQTSLMRHTAAVVGHGGFGTTLTALAGGVPQVVVPMFASDQWINARSVAEAGVGISLIGGPDAASRLAEAVTQVLKEAAYRRAATALAAEIAALPTTDESVQALVATARQHDVGHPPSAVD